MHTESGLKGLRKAQLIVILTGMAVTFSESATNAEMIELILAEQAKQDRATPETSQDSEASGEHTHASAEETPATDNPCTDEHKADDSSDISDSLIVRARHKTGFYRCGRFWPHDGRKIALSELSDNEIAALRAEKNLIVE